MTNQEIKNKFQKFIKIITIPINYDFLLNLELEFGEDIKESLKQYEILYNYNYYVDEFEKYSKFINNNEGLNGNIIYKENDDYDLLIINNVVALFLYWFSELNFDYLSSSDIDNILFFIEKLLFELMYKMSYKFDSTNNLYFYAYKMYNDYQNIKVNIKNSYDLQFFLKVKISCIVLNILFKNNEIEKGIEYYKENKKYLFEIDLINELYKAKLSDELLKEIPLEYLYFILSESEKINVINIYEQTDYQNDLCNLLKLYEKGELLKDSYDNLNVNNLKNNIFFNFDNINFRFVLCYYDLMNDFLTEKQYIFENGKHLYHVLFDYVNKKFNNKFVDTNFTCFFNKIENAINNNENLLNLLYSLNNFEFNFESENSKEQNCLETNFMNFDEYINNLSNNQKYKKPTLGIYPMFLLLESISSIHIYVNELRDSSNYKLKKICTDFFDIFNRYNQLNNSYIDLNSRIYKFICKLNEISEEKYNEYIDNLVSSNYKNFSSEELNQFFIDYLNSNQFKNNNIDKDKVNSCIIKLQNANDIKQIISVNEAIFKPFKELNSNYVYGDYTNMVVCQIKALERYLKEIIIKCAKDNKKSLYYQNRNLVFVKNDITRKNKEPGFVFVDKNVTLENLCKNDYRNNSIAIEIGTCITFIKNNKNYFISSHVKKSIFDFKYNINDSLLYKNWVSIVRNQFMHVKEINSFEEAKVVSKSTAYWFLLVVDELIKL